MMSHHHCIPNGAMYPHVRLLWIKYAGDKYGVPIHTQKEVINQYDLHAIAKAKWDKMTDEEKEADPMPSYDPDNVLENNGRDKQIIPLCKWMNATFKYAADNVYCRYIGNTYGAVPYNSFHIYNQYEMGRIYYAHLKDMFGSIEKSKGNAPYYYPFRYDGAFVAFKRMVDFIGADYIGKLKLTYKIHARDYETDPDAIRLRKEMKIY